MSAEVMTPIDLGAVRARMNEAESKRERSRREPNPIFDAGMILAIQVSSADVPGLIAQVESDAAKIATVLEIHKKVWHECINLDGSKYAGWICDGCTGVGEINVLTIHPCPTFKVLGGTK